MPEKSHSPSYKWPAGGRIWVATPLPGLDPRSDTEADFLGLLGRRLLARLCWVSAEKPFLLGSYCLGQHPLVSLGKKLALDLGFWLK